MPGLSLYSQVELRLGRPLARQLRQWREARVSAPAMARLLYLETDLAMTGQTVRRWLDELDLDDEMSA